MLKNSLSKLLDILRIIQKLGIKNYQSFLLDYISNEFPYNIDILKNNTIIISNNFIKIGKKEKLKCDPLQNLGICKIKTKKSIYFAIFSPYYDIYIASQMNFKIDKPKIKKEILNILLTIPNILIYTNHKLIKGKFSQDSFYFFKKVKNFDIFFGVGIKYKEIERLTNLLTKKIHNKIFHLLIYFISLYLIFIIFFYTTIFIFFNKKAAFIQELFDEYSKKANTDKLTSLLNREGFENKIKENNCKYFSIIDLDNFKYINDTFGHETGDKILKKFSNLLKTYFPNSIIGRWGGDEFLICTNKSKEEIIENFKKINKQLTFFQSQFDKNPKKLLSVSVGTCDNHKLPLKKRFINADLALYKVKKSNKGNIVFYSDINYIKIEKNDLNQL
jgi:diguanylate cyclase (GGDEF)-like protein